MTRRLLVVALLPLAIACESRSQRLAADSAATAQAALAAQLAAQKDSLTRVVLDADAFIARIDSQVSRVKGLPTAKRRNEPLEGPLEEQLQARADMLARVEGLVDRARTTATQLEASRRRETTLRGEVAALKGKADEDQRLIADLGATIERQREAISVLHVQVDSLTRETVRLGDALTQSERGRTAAWYIIGTERELIEKGIVVREGGANLLVARVGRTLQPARTLDPALFTPIDRRAVREIAVPDSTREYAIVSRQSLDAAQVAARDRARFRGNLHIADVDRFWEPSPYLIIVQK